MSKRVSWQCPRCGRSFRMPASRRLPDVCRTCAGTQHSGQDMPVHFEEASTGSTAAPAPPAPSISAPDSHPVAADPTAAHDRSADRQTEILDQLKTINRTMTFFRRLVWGMILAMIFHVILMGIGAVYAIRMLGSLDGLIQPAGAGNVGGLPEETQQQLQQIREYSTTVNELLQETR